ncbi:MAG: hypothetical protein NUV61_00040 [Candidatus Azambacteria bacterium]|nr:hypothetical protein [Candidatus Azambacteria bacterium]
MLTIFANLRIENEDGLLHLKDSFFSFSDISDDWLINIRGKLREEALAFLTQHLGEKMRRFELVDDSRGWMTNALDMLPYAKHEYIFVWNEDHINLAPHEIYKEIVREMKEKKVDYLLYSWWQFGKARKAFDQLQLLTPGNYIDTVHMTPSQWKQVQKTQHPYYLISLCGIFHVKFFEKLLRKDKKKIPLFFTKQLYRFMTLLQYGIGKFNQTYYFHKIDSLFFHILRRFRKETPFDLEKAPDRTDILPITIAVSKHELFACIDDDLDTPGYQLIKRGKYPLSFSLDADKILEGGNKVIESTEEYEVTKLSLRTDEEYRCAYYEDSIRITHIVKETIIITMGRVQIATRREDNILSAHEAVVVYPNVGYMIVALEDAHMLIVSPSRKKKTLHYNGPQGIENEKHD